MKVNTYPRIAIASLTATAALGVGLFYYGRTFPVYSNIDRARELKGPGACDANGPVDGWYEQLGALETLRHPLMQGGISLVLAALTLGILMYLFADGGRSRFRTPRSRTPFFVLGTGVFLLSWFAQMISLNIDLDRGSFPWCADTIIIGMGQISVGYLILFAIALIVGALLSTRLKHLPAHLFAWRSDEKMKSVSVTVPFAVIGILIVVLGIDGATLSSFLATPAAIVALYLTEATRSALLAREADIVDA